MIRQSLDRSKVPLRRKTGLKARPSKAAVKSEVARRSGGSVHREAPCRSEVLPAVGKRRRERQPYLASTYRIVMRRANGKCENPVCSVTVKLELAHLFGRGATGARMSEPWATCPELCLALCGSNPRTGHLGCHQKNDQYLDNSLRCVLADICTHRFVAAYLSGFVMPRHLSIPERLRQLCAEASSRGSVPPNWARLHAGREERKAS